MQLVSLIFAFLQTLELAQGLPFFIVLLTMILMLLLLLILKVFIFDTVHRLLLSFIPLYYVASFPPKVLLRAHFGQII